MDCSSFKTIHELGLDPCERGRFISSRFKISIIIYDLCTQGSSHYSFIHIIHLYYLYYIILYMYNYYIILLIYLIKN